MEIINTKWAATVSSIWIQCAAGASYTFSIYSSILKSSQGYSQATLDTVSVFKDIGANAGVVSGLFYSAVTLNRHNSRPWIVHLAGAAQFFLGYFMMWASVVGLVGNPPVWLMCVYMLLAAHGQTFLNTTNVVCGVHNFRDYSGTIVGIMKGFLGLSGAILIQFYDTVCNDPATYILLLALTPAVVSLLFMTFVRNYDTSSKDDKKYLNAFSAVALTIAAYLTVLIILENVLTMPLWLRIVTFAGLLLLVALPLGIAIRAQREEDDRYAQALLTEKDYKPNEVNYHELPSGVPEGTSSELPSGEGQAEDGAREDLNPLQAMATGNFWLLFVAIFCGLGSGLATCNNMNQIGESLNYTTIEINSLVSLWSIWNFLGRFGAGFLSDIFLRRNGWARPIFMAITLAVMSIGHIIIASGFSGNLYLGSVLVGVCYGSQWSLMPTISSEIFGVSHLGTIFNTIAIAAPLGSYIFSVRVIGYLYDEEATGDDNTCLGKKCFMLSFLILASVAFFGFLVALVLFFRTRRFYKVVVLGRLHHTIID